MRLEDKVFKDVVTPLFEDIRVDLYSQCNRHGNLGDDVGTDIMKHQLLLVKTELSEAINKLGALEQWVSLLRESQQEK